MTIKKRLAVGFIIFIVSFLLYFPTLQNGFVYDDNEQIINNRYIKDIRNIPEIFSSSVWSFREVFCDKDYYYRPLMHLFYMAEYHFFQDDSYGYHLLNVILHALNGFLLFLFIYFFLKANENHIWKQSERKRGSMGAVSFLGALIWSLHPINSEAVNWVAALPELLLLLFFLGSFYFYILFEKKEKIIYKIFSLILFILSLLSKETAMVIPFVFFVYSFIFSGSRITDHILAKTKSWLRKNFCYLIVLIAYLLLRRYILGSFLLGTGDNSILALMLFYANAPDIFIQNISNVILPWKLSLFHSYRFTSERALFISSIFFISPFIYMFFAQNIVFDFRSFKPEVNRIYYFSFFLFMLPLLPATNPFLGNFVLSERYLYVSSIGFALGISFMGWNMLNFLFKKESKTTRSFFLLIGVIIIIFGVIVIERNSQWRDDCSISQDAVQKYPLAMLGHERLGTYYCDSGNMSGCEEEFAKAIELHQFDGESKINIQGNYHYILGKSYLKHKEYEKAGYYFNLALPTYKRCPIFQDYVRSMIEKNGL